MDTLSVVILALTALAAMGGVWAIIEIRNDRARKHRMSLTEQFLHARKTIKNQRADLVDRALEIDRSARLDRDLRVLRGPGWVLDEPQPLDHLELVWAEQVPPPAAEVSAALSRCDRWWPESEDGTPTRGYSEAIEKFDQPYLWWDSDSYRLLDVEVRQDRIRLTHGLCRYFDSLDTQEVLGFELAKNLAQEQPGSKLHYRTALGGPLELEARCALPAVVTLTIRRGERGPRFFMHHRDKGNVATSQNTYHLAPVGEFEPSNTSLAARRTDFDLWRTIMREYAEEFLDRDEAYGKGGEWIDYADTWPFSALEAARRGGGLSVWALGIVLEPITWKPHVLTVAVFDEETFDRIFGTRIFGKMSSRNNEKRNKEGILIVGNRRNRGTPFDEQHVADYTKDPKTDPTAQAALELALKHRAHMNLPAT